jgi:hypothetical protein
MEEKISEDIGEEIISRLKELIRVLEEKFKNQDEKKCPSAYRSREQSFG